MTVVVSSRTDGKKRIYHRHGCIYAGRIKPGNRMEISIGQAQEHHYHECKYCVGLRGDVRVHKTAFAAWSQKRKVNFYYHKGSDTLYIRTEIGCWKIFLKEELGKYLLYHRNTYSAEMKLGEVIYGDFHRQSDVKATDSMEKLVDYIVAHDRAKITIMEDYRKLPKRTKKQKKYYRAAERRDKRNAAKRLDDIFAALEQSQAGMKRYSFC